MMRTVILKIYVSANQLAEEARCVLETVMHLGPEGSELSDTLRFSLNSASLHSEIPQQSLSSFSTPWCSCACSYCLWCTACSLRSSWSWMRVYTLVSPTLAFLFSLTTVLLFEVKLLGKEYTAFSWLYLCDLHQNCICYEIRQIWSKSEIFCLFVVETWENDLSL